MNNVNPIFEGLLNSMAPKTEEKRNSFLHDCIVKFLEKARRNGMSIKGDNIGGWHFVGPEAAEWDTDIKYLAISQGANVQEMPVNIADCIEESGIQVVR